MKITLSNRILLEGMPTGVIQKVCERLTLKNPKYIDAQKQGRWTGGIEEYILFYRLVNGSGLSVPRGFLYEIPQVPGCLVDDNRYLSPQANFEFKAELTADQKKAVDTIMPWHFATLEAPTGAGKTVMGLYMIKARMQTALIIVHSKELMHQWADRVRTFMGIEPGIIAGPVRKSKKITIGMLQTLDNFKKIQGFGHIIADECHRAPAMMYARVLEKSDAFYTTGLSATPFRRDGLTSVIDWTVGPIRAKVKKQDLLDSGALCQASVRQIYTGFFTDTDPSENYSTALSEICEKDGRNFFIAAFVNQNHGGSGIALVLSDRKDHCQKLRMALVTRGIIPPAEIAVLTGAEKNRPEIVKDLQDGKISVLIATGQLIGEGFDLPEIRSLFLTTPIKFPGRLIQYIGRALRPAAGKTSAMIYDFVDGNRVFQAQAWTRLNTYKQQGLTITEWRIQNDLE